MPQTETLRRAALVTGGAKGIGRAICLALAENGVNIAVNYGGRPEIVRAARQLAQQVAEGTLKPEDITEEMMSDHMYTAGQKDPDFILRPSGEKRLSNFMLWQASYAELVEMDVLWPDFTRDDLDAAITEFNKRSRRFGGI